MNARSPAMGLGPLEQHASLTFHSVEYAIYSTVQHDVELLIEAEQISDGSRWSGVFKKKYIEEMTANTGNFKKFPIFVDMLWAALRGSTESVYVDLLTSSDLDNLRNRNSHRKAQCQKTMSESTIKNKRYLILTYTVEFDRVHYPLLLRYVCAPESASLQRTIQRLRVEIGQLKESAGRYNPNNDELFQQLQEEHRRLIVATNEQRESHEVELADRKRLTQDLREKLAKEKLKVHTLIESNDQLRMTCQQYEKEGILRRNRSNSIEDRRFRSPSSSRLHCPKQLNGSPRRPRRSRSQKSPVAPRARPHPLLGRTSPIPPRRKGRSRSPHPPKFDPTAYVRNKQKLQMNRSPSPWGKPPAPKPRARSTSLDRRSASTGTYNQRRANKENAVPNGDESLQKPSRERYPPLVSVVHSKAPLARQARSPTPSSSSSSSDYSSRRPHPTMIPFKAPSTSDRKDRVETHGQIQELDQRLSELQRYLRDAKSTNHIMGGDKSNDE